MEVPASPVPALPTTPFTHALIVSLLELAYWI